MIPMSPKSEYREEFKLLIPMNLGFFEGGDKTEKATPKKRQKAREEGQVAKSPEIGTAVLLISMFASLGFFGDYMFNGLMDIFSYSFGRMDLSVQPFDMNQLTQLFVLLSIRGGLILLPLFAVAMAVGIITNIVQVGWHPTLKPLMPKFSKLNPLSGIKRLFSSQALVNLFKSLVKFAIIIFCMYNVLMAQQNKLFLFLDLSLFEAVALIGETMINLGITVGGLYIFIAGIDFAYTRFKHAKDLRMTKQEIKEEYKMTEGNPQIKGQIRQRMRESSMRRMMAQVPNADVIITNPTHFAIALKYDISMGLAPVVLAKGADFVAKKIREKAKEHNIMMVENKPLAKALYDTVEVGSEIPPQLYQAVAEILAYVYKLKNIA